MRIKLGIPMSLSDIAKKTGGTLLVNDNTRINYVTTDSREVCPGDLFIAIEGEKFDGEDYVIESKEHGAFILSKNEKVADIFHTDTRRALLSFAEKYVENLPIILYRIGITGSVGKTTTKEFLKTLLEGRYKCHASEANFNNEIGMPMSMISAPANAEILIMEMGMNHPGEISKLTHTFKPNIALITNVGTAHIGNLGSRESIAKAKLEICEGLDSGITIVPENEPLLIAAKNRKSFSAISCDSNYYLASNVDGSISIYKDKKHYCNATFTPEGEHHKLCLAAAAAAAIEVGLTEQDVRKGILRISGDNTRQRTIFCEKYCFFTDFYNASFESVLALINLAENHKTSSKKSLVLGDILELGEMSKKIHFNIGKSISPLIFHNLFLYGKESDNIRLGAIENHFPDERIFPNFNTENPRLTAEQIRENCEEGEIIFMKASRGTRLEKILNCFMAKEEMNE